MKPVFGVLGPLLTPAGPIGAAKHRILLASLLLRPGEAVPVAELTEQLWEADPPAGPRAAIQTYVKRLRQRLGASVIRTSGRGYLADVPPESVDVFQFRELVRAAEEADTRSRSRLLGEALGLWRGQALTDVPSAALHADFGVRLGAERVRALELRFGTELELGRSSELVADLRAATAEHPLHEEFWAQLMLTLYRSDRQAEALAAFTEVTGVLTAELSADPGQGLRELHQRILNQDNSLHAPKSVTAAAPRVLPAQLPLDIPDFVGRTANRAEIIPLLRDSVPVLISGPPGVGKTALAIRIAHTLRPDFPDGQLHVNLRGFDAHQPMTAAQVLSRFLRGLGVAADEVPVGQPELAARYQEQVRGRRLLIVLDNAASADQVHGLLPTGPGCAVIITSRHELPDLAGAGRHRLDVLPLRDSQELLTAALGPAATNAEPEAIDALANLCSFLPLALRIAAANIAESPHADLRGFVSELEAGNRLNDLSITGDEQTAVRNTFDRSYLALTPAARQLFSRLSLVPGSDFTSAEAAALMDTAPDDVQPVLHQLSSAHLLQRQQDDRFGFHDLLRLYASERLTQSTSKGQEADFRERLYGHYLSSARAACARLYPGVFHLYPEAFPAPSDSRFTDVEQARSWLDSESANLVAAVSQSTKDQIPEISWQITDALRRYLQSAGLHLDQLLIGMTCLDTARKLEDRSTEAYMLATVSQSHFKSGNYRKSQNIADQALQLYRELEHTAGELHCLNMLGTIGIKIGEVDSSIQHYRSSLQLSNASGDRVGAAIALTNLSSAYWMIARLDDFTTAAEDAATRAQGVGIQELLVVCQVNLAAGLNSIGKFTEAAPVAEQVLQSAMIAGAKESQALAHNEIAIAHHSLGHYTRAAAEASAALEVTRGTASLFAEASSLSIKSLALHKAGDHAAAREFSDRAVRLSSEKDLAENLALALNHRGTILAEHEPERAVEDVTRAVAITREHGYLLREHQALTTLARLRLLTGELEAAQKTAVAALSAHISTGHRPGQAHTLHVLGDIAHRADDLVAARSTWEQAQDLFRVMGMPEAAEVETSIAALG